MQTHEYKRGWTVNTKKHFLKNMNSLILPNAEKPLRHNGSSHEVWNFGIIALKKSFPFSQKGHLISISIFSFHKNSCFDNKKKTLLFIVTLNTYRQRALLEKILQWLKVATKSVPKNSLTIDYPIGIF
jgi:hypothetical protein